MRDRHTRRSYAGRRVPRRPLIPRHRAGGAGPAQQITRLGLALLIGIGLLLVTTTAVIASSAYSSYSQIAASLTPRLDALANHKAFQTSRIYDRNGTLLYEFFDTGKRTKVDFAG